MATVLKERLYTRVVGRRILSYKELSSTMDLAAQEAREGTIEGTVVLATEQTMGRGRLQRTWVSRPGNLLLSIVFYPSLKELPYLSMLPSLAVVRAIVGETGLAPDIKWPNDILIMGKKVAGVLVENTLEGDAISYAIVGIGINIAMDTSEIPEIAPIATSLDLESGQNLDPAKILRRVLQELDKLYVAVSEGVSPVEEWRGHLGTLGKRVTIQWGNEVVSGLAEGVNDTGHLLLRRDDGGRVDLPGGEVTFQLLSEDST